MTLKLKKDSKKSSKCYKEQLKVSTLIILYLNK